MAITIEDVKQALAELGVTAQNANAGTVRAKLGTGSFATIQKHLETLRTVSQVRPVSADVEPPPPDVLRALWELATAAATRPLAGRIERLTQERDSLSSALDSSRVDLEAALSEAESLENRRSESTNEAAFHEEKVAELQSLRDADARLIAELRELAKENGLLHETIGSLKARLEKGAAKS